MVIDQVPGEQRCQDGQQQQVEPVGGAQQLRCEHDEDGGEQQAVDQCWQKRGQQRRQPGRGPERDAPAEPQCDQQDQPATDDFLSARPARQRRQYDAGDDCRREAEDELVAMLQFERHIAAREAPQPNQGAQPGGGQQRHIQRTEEIERPEGAGPKRRQDQGSVHRWKGQAELCGMQFALHCCRCGPPPYRTPSSGSRWAATTACLPNAVVAAFHAQEISVESDHHTGITVSTNSVIGVFQLPNFRHNLRTYSIFLLTLNNCYGELS